MICSPAAAASRWVNEEVKCFKRLHGEDRVRAIIVGGDPFSNDPATECFPEALRFRTGADGELSGVRAEPIAADLRPGGDGKRFAISKLVAGLTGTRLDELVQREHHRRSRKLRALAAGLGALVFLFAGLAFEATRQRNAARLAQIEAETARKDAEGLVEFMLTDLRTRLNAVGRLDVLDSVGERALAYYDARDLGQADPDALGRRARAQLLVGEIDNLRGDLGPALKAYLAAAATTEEQLARDPRNPQRIFDHAQSVFWVGYIAWQRGDVLHAKQRFTQYHDYARQLLAIAPDKDEWQMELDFAYSNLGTLALDQGQAAAAEDYFRKSLAVSSRLAGKHPGDVDHVIAQGQSYAWLADALHRQAKVAAARAARLAELALYARFEVGQADNAVITNRRATALYRLAQIEIAAGELQEAVARAGAAVNAFDQLSADDPDNMEPADRASLAHAVLGEAYFHLGQAGQARATLQRSIEIAEQLVARDDSVAQWREQNLALPQVTLARVYAAAGDTAAAHRLFATVTENLRQPALRDNADPRTVAYLLRRARRPGTRLRALRTTLVGDRFDAVAKSRQTKPGRTHPAGRGRCGPGQAGVCGRNYIETLAGGLSPPGSVVRARAAPDARQRQSRGRTVIICRDRLGLSVARRRRSSSLAALASDFVEPSKNQFTQGDLHAHSTATVRARSCSLPS